MPADDGLDLLLAPRTGSAATRAPSPARGPKGRPDPRPLRIAFAVTGIAAASAIATAILTPPSAASGTTQVVTVALPGTQQAQPSPTHVTTYIRLAPGQTAPPQAAVQQLPAPAPRVVVVTTRQSGTP